MAPYEMTVSNRDAEVTRARLQTWLAARQPGAVITDLHRPEGNGMSSETLLFDATWDGVSHALVARVEPAVEDVPVFMTYDLPMQFRVMQLVAERSDTPVPECLWLETDASVIGAPFFVMGRIDGRVPRDNLPYTFDGWLVDAPLGDRIAMQDDSVWALAGIHGVDLAGVDLSFLGHDVDGPSALRQHVDYWHTYYDWCCGSERIPLIDAAFAWLDAHWPADDGGRAVLSWGDSRIGNMMFDGFRPVAVLDWEMAGIAPRGVDLGWMAYLHIFFQDIAQMMELPGIPDFMVMADLAETYEARTGVTVGDHDFWLVYAALRYDLIMKRINQRQVAFGEVEPSDDPEAGILHADWLRTAIA